MTPSAEQALKASRCRLVHKAPRAKVHNSLRGSFASSQALRPLTFESGNLSGAATAHKDAHEPLKGSRKEELHVQIRPREVDDNVLGADCAVSASQIEAEPFLVQPWKGVVFRPAILAQQQDDISQTSNQCFPRYQRSIRHWAHLIDIDIRSYRIDSFAVWSPNHFHGQLIRLLQTRYDSLSPDCDTY
ncbi:hypothetical protein EJ07DRAFT_159920 [Lizonia empirigonia]|nr:hypothetical protein EJ07DRAFT_159920 [Lizonia empirigonia]